MTNMKKYSILFFWVVSMAMTTSCQKEGPIGPDGQQGAQGAQGIPGTNGNVFLFGNIPPGSALGHVGDFYIDKKTDLLYGPKGTSGWGIPVSLRDTSKWLV